MPRATRSRKIIIAEDDTAIASQVPLPDTPRKERPALAEITVNPEEEIMTAEDAELATQLKGLKAAYKTAIGVKKNKKGKAKKAAKKPLELVNIGSSQDVVDDEQCAAVSPAAEGARRILSSDEEELPSTEEERIKTPPSPAVRETRQRLAETRAAGTIGGTDISTSPKKGGVTTLEAVEKADETEDVLSERPNGTAEDSFVEQIIARSPAKPVTRIEDSVEALDKMEEAIEALGQAALTVSPTETTITAPVKKKVVKAVAKPFSSLRVKSQDARPNVKGMEGADCKAKEGVKKCKSSSTLRDAMEASDGKVVVAKKPIKRPASLLPPKEPVKSAKPPTKPTFELPGEAVARKLKEQREARKAQRESSDEVSTSVKAPVSASKVKSAKPPTKPTFELPGEAISRKKREAHEARLKAQEEEEKKRREFKAKPPRKSIQPNFVPRETAASLARKSQVMKSDIENGISSNQRNSISVTKRGSIIGAHRPSIQAANLANISAPRSPGPANASQAQHTRKASTTSGPSMSGLAMQRTVSASEAQLQRQRAREIYMRDTKALEEMEKEKREREAAAKKSRLEAAERGRQASREWAEKQRAKKAADGDKGLAPGYGPGGQLGLKG